MNRSATMQDKLKPPSRQRGRYKCAIYFIDHKMDKAFVMHSTRGQDSNGTFVGHIQRLIKTGKFAGKVNWAGIYEQERQIFEFRNETGDWLPV